MTEKFEDTVLDLENEAKEDWEKLYKDWGELYKKIDISKVLQKVKELLELEALPENQDQYMRTLPLELRGSYKNFDGDVSFSGLKREILMLFDPNREDNTVFIHLPDAVKDEVRKINLEDYLKK